MNFARNFASRHEFCWHSWQGCAEILAARNLLLSKDLVEIHGRILARFWLLGFFASRQDWPQDPDEILAARIFASQRESCQDPAGNKNPGSQNLACSLRTQMYFQLSLVPPKIMSVNSSRRLISVTSKLLFCCWLLKFNHRIWDSHTRATLQERVIIFESWICSQWTRRF